MENKFDKKRFAVIMMQTFVTAYTHGRSVTDVYDRLREKVNTNSKIEKDEERRATLEECRKILEKCRDFFKDPSIKKSVDTEISVFRDEMNSTIGRNPSDAEISKRLLSSFSDEFWGDGKRKYNMSQLATDGTITPFKSSKGNIVKAEYKSFEDEFVQSNTDEDEIPEPPSIHLEDRRGNPIDIEYMGRLVYHNGSSNEYIYKHRITKTINGVKKTYEKYSNIEINKLQDNLELCSIVISELLTEYNLEHSEADDYIGEITTPEIPSLKVGEEKEDSGFYRYQITSKYALEYDGEKIEAIRAYKQQEANKENTQEADKDDDFDR